MKACTISSLLFIFLLNIGQLIYAQSFSEMGAYNTLGVPTYLDKQNEIISSTLLEDLNILLPNGENLLKTNPSLYHSNKMTAITLKQTGDVYLSFVSEGADFKSAVGYYTFNGTAPDHTFQIKNLKIVFPNVSGNGSGGGLTRGNRVKLGNFPAGTSIGFFIIANGYQYEKVMPYGNDVFYTEPKYNPEFKSELKKHAVILFDNVSNKYVLLFEDFNRERGSDHDFNDAIFTISTESSDVLITDGASVIQKEKEIKLGGGNNPPSKNITICHYPPGNKTNPKTITIPEIAWEVHKAHGDKQGDCSSCNELKIEGEWKLAGSDQINTVKSVTNGINVKTSKNPKWFFYFKINANTFKDTKGNTYTFKDDCTAEWKSPSGKIIKLIRVEKTPSDNLNPKTDTLLDSNVKKITICHYPPGNPTNPQEISIPESAWKVHEAHGDVMGKCDETPTQQGTPVTPPEKKITICHYPPGNPNNPQEISIPESAWKAHEAHGDVMGKCDGPPQQETPVTQPEKKITICHYPPGNSNNPQEISIPESAWKTHEAHGDVMGKCDGTQPQEDTTVSQPEKKITICHYPPGNPNNPQELSIPESAWKAHEAHGDVMGKCDGTQPQEETPVIKPEKKITICHYPPGNTNNPQEISIPESAWKAHEAHGDVKGGCNSKSKEKEEKPQPKSNPGNGTTNQPLSELKKQA